MAKKIRADSTKAISPDVLSGYVSVDTNGKETQTVQPKDDLSEFIELWQDDDVSTAVRILVDAVIKSGYKIVRSDKEDESYDDALKKLISKYSFDEQLIKILNDLILFRKSYVNLIKKPVKNGSVIVNVTEELHVLSPAYIRPIVNKHGDVLGYIQQVPQVDPIKFSKDELVELELYPTTSGYWGYQDLKSLYDVVKLKKLLEDYVNFVYANNKLPDVWIIKEQISKDQFALLEKQLKEKSANPKGHLVLTGDAEHVFPTDQQFLRDILEVLYYLRGKIYEFFGVPPVFAGFVEGATRGAGDVQVRLVFNDKVTSLKDRVESLINTRLFKAMGLRAKIVFNPYDRLELKDRVQMALQLKALNVSENTLKFFLSHGYLPENITFSRLNLNAKRVRDELTNKTAPSRQPVDKDVKKLNQKTGYESTTRQDQIFGK